MMINQTYSNLNLSHAHTKKKEEELKLCCVLLLTLICFTLIFILFALSHDFCLYSIYLVSTSAYHSHV